MPRFLSTLLFFAVIAGVAAFIWISGQLLPPTVASHFGASGVANGFSGRAVYINLMMGIGIGLPLLVGLMPTLLIRMPGARINVPNRDYWLAPERRAQTIDALCAHMRVCGSMTALFLGITHWLVVKANLSQPVALPMDAFMPVLIGFMGCMLLWVISLFWRFRRVS